MIYHNIVFISWIIHEKWVTQCFYRDKPRPALVSVIVLTISPSLPGTAMDR